MKFRNPETGEVFDDIKAVIDANCEGRSCEDCGVGDKGPCPRWSYDHQREAARLMGYEVIEEEPKRNCFTCWRYKDKNFPCAIPNIDRSIGCSAWEKKEVNMEQEDKPAAETVDHPAHYNQGGIECIDAIKAAVEGLTGIRAFCAGNAIKYIWRHDKKNGVQDLDKAIWYINRLKEEIGNG